MTYSSNPLDGGPFCEPGNSPFCPATGKLVRFCKGGASAPKQAVAPAAAAETRALVGQAVDDEYTKDQERRRRNRTVIGAASDPAYGQNLKLGQ